MSSALDFLSATLSSSLGLLSKHQTERKNNPPRRNLPKLLVRWPFLSHYSRVLQRRHHLHQPSSFLRRRWAFLLLLPSSSSSSCSSSFLNPDSKLVVSRSLISPPISVSLSRNRWRLPRGFCRISLASSGRRRTLDEEEEDGPSSMNSVFVRVFIMSPLFVDGFIRRSVSARFVRSVCSKKIQKISLVQAHAREVYGCMY